MKGRLRYIMLLSTAMVASIGWPEANTTVAPKRTHDGPSYELSRFTIDNGGNRITEAIGQRRRILGQIFQCVAISIAYERGHHIGAECGQIIRIRFEIRDHPGGGFRPEPAAYRTGRMTFAIEGGL